MKKKTVPQEPPKFIRNTLDVDDIVSKTPKKKMFAIEKRPGSLLIDDIEGSQARRSPLLITKPQNYDNLDYRDVTETRDLIRI